MIESYGALGWKLESTCVSGFVTQFGAMLFPLDFRLGERIVSPMHVAPWWAESMPDQPPIIAKLRGDFFCMPFGSNALPFQGEKHPIHGEPANAPWSLIDSHDGRIELELTTRARPATLRREVWFEPNRPVVHQRHIVDRLRGPMSYGMHAMLAFRTGGRVSVGMNWGLTFDGPFESPEQGGYPSLPEGLRFESLDEIGLDRYPARAGFEDLVQIVAAQGEFGWTAVTFPQERFLWLQVKRNQELPSTILWHSNGGRHYAPWNGRHRRVLGIEEVCSAFHRGLTQSVEPNPFSKSGVSTVREFDGTPTQVCHVVQTVAQIPTDFEAVKRVEFEEGAVVAIDAQGQQMRCAIDLP